MRLRRTSMQSKLVERSGEAPPEVVSHPPLPYVMTRWDRPGSTPWCEAASLPSFKALGGVSLRHKACRKVNRAWTDIVDSLRNDINFIPYIIKQTIVPPSAKTYASQ